MNEEIISKEVSEGKKTTKMKIDKFNVTIESNEPSPNAIERFNKMFVKLALEGEFTKGVSA